jgi:hypothetical protein
MAKQRDGIDTTFIASADLSTKQYYIMEHDSTADELTTADGATDKPAGILQNKPAADGREALIRIAGHSKVIAGEDSLAAGDLVGTSAQGSAVAITPGTDTTAYILGQITVGCDSGEIAEMVIWQGGRAA